MLECGKEATPLQHRSSEETNVRAASYARRAIRPRIGPLADRYVDCPLLGGTHLLEVLHSALPKMSLIVSDFSYLPEVSIPGARAPLVSTKVISSQSDQLSSFDTFNLLSL
ncbi:hypothetical protein BHE74_00026069 [Ensete ventricosum]|nr:hypothetical protein BHE74_00026069 [Ensete ventricosum]